MIKLICIAVRSPRMSYRIYRLRKGLRHVRLQAVRVDH